MFGGLVQVIASANWGGDFTQGLGVGLKAGLTGG